MVFRNCIFIQKAVKENMHFKIGSEAHMDLFCFNISQLETIYTINDRTLHWTSYSTEQLFLIHLFCFVHYSFFILKPMSIDLNIYHGHFFSFFLLTYSIILCFVLNFFWMDMNHILYLCFCHSAKWRRIANHNTEKLVKIC